MVQQNGHTKSPSEKLQQHLSSKPSTSVDIKRKLDITSSDLRSARIDGGFWYARDLVAKVEKYHTFKEKDIETDKKLLQDISDAAAEFTKKETEAKEKNTWMSEDYEIRRDFVKKLKEKADEEIKKLNVEPEEEKKSQRRPTI